MLLPPVARRYAGLWLAAVLLPVGASAAAIVVNVDPALWWSLSAASRRDLTADALLYTIGAVVLFAPLGGVVVASARGAVAAPAGWRALDTFGTLLAAVALLVMTSVSLVVVGWGQSDADALRLIATSHATMFAVALALAGFGAVCGAMFADALDAAGCSLSLVLASAAWLLVGGASLADAPRPLIDLAVAANPLVTMASAAHIDVVRMTVPYQMSPLARLQVQYPSWSLACLWYLVFAGLCFLGVAWQARSWQWTTVKVKGRIA